MKVGIITTPNAKGQIVIPKAVRDALGINSSTPVNLQLRGDGIYIHPIKEILGKHETQNGTSAYSEILKKTLGAWKNDNWPETERKRRMVELKEARQAKKAW